MPYILFLSIIKCNDVAHNILHDTLCDMAYKLNLQQLIFIAPAFQLILSIPSTKSNLQTHQLMSSYQIQTSKNRSFMCRL